MLKIFTCLFTLSSFTVAFAQSSYADKIPAYEKYDPKKVVDEEYGITLYTKLIESLGGDSTRYNKKGYKVEGDMEDYYLDNKPIHKGFYVEGKLKQFKNFYPNSAVERSFRMLDLKKSELIQYYSDGKTKSQINFFESYVLKQTDFYKNGKLSYEEENTKNGDLIKRNSYREDGTPSIFLELTDKKKKIYSRKEFFQNGKIKEEGTMLYLSDLSDFVKEGQWSTYDENGKLISKQNYHNGESNNE